MIALRRPMFPTIARPSFAGMVATVERWLERRSQRRALLALDDKLVKDIGLGQADVWQEADKPFWRA